MLQFSSTIICGELKPSFEKFSIESFEAEYDFRSTDFCSTDFFQNCLQMVQKTSDEAYFATDICWQMLCILLEKIVKLSDEEREELSKAERFPTGNKKIDIFLFSHTFAEFQGSIFYHELLVDTPTNREKIFEICAKSINVEGNSTFVQKEFSRFKIAMDAPDSEAYISNPIERLLIVSSCECKDKGFNYEFISFLRNMKEGSIQISSESLKSLIENFSLKDFNTQKEIDLKEKAILENLKFFLEIERRVKKVSESKNDDDFLSLKNTNKLATLKYQHPIKTLFSISIINRSLENDSLNRMQLVFYLIRYIRLETAIPQVIQALKNRIRKEFRDLGKITEGKTEVKIYNSNDFIKHYVENRETIISIESLQNLMRQGVFSKKGIVYNYNRIQNLKKSISFCQTEFRLIRERLLYEDEIQRLITDFAEFATFFTDLEKIVDLITKGKVNKELALDLSNRVNKVKLVQLPEGCREPVKKFIFLVEFFLRSMEKYICFEEEQKELEEIFEKQRKKSILDSIDKKCLGVIFFCLEDSLKLETFDCFEKNSEEVNKEFFSRIPYFSLLPKYQSVASKFIQRYPQNSLFENNLISEKIFLEPFLREGEFSFPILDLNDSNVESVDYYDARTIFYPNLEIRTKIIIKNLVSGELKNFSFAGSVNFLNKLNFALLNRFLLTFPLGTFLQDLSRDSYLRDTASFCKDPHAIIFFEAETIKALRVGILSASEKIEPRNVYAKDPTEVEPDAPSGILSQASTAGFPETKSQIREAGLSEKSVKSVKYEVSTGDQRDEVAEELQKEEPQRKELQREEPPREEPSSPSERVSRKPQGLKEPSAPKVYFQVFCFAVLAFCIFLFVSSSENSLIDEKQITQKLNEDNLKILDTGEA